MKAIIFAAGLGTRLQPFTLHHPKALVTVNGKPMLQHVIEKLHKAGVEDMVINVHHFAQQIIDFLHNNSNFGCNISISDETSMLLDTGGGIAKASPMLIGNEAFIAYNADILSDFDINSMIKAHNESKADVTLLTSSRDSSRQLYFNDTNRLIGWQNVKSGECKPTNFTPDEHCHPSAFNGVHIISQKTLQSLQRKAANNPVFSITPFYIENIYNLNIRSFQPDVPYQWYDVGRNETLTAARNGYTEK